MVRLDWRLWCGLGLLGCTPTLDFGATPETEGPADARLVDAAADLSVRDALADHRVQDAARMDARSPDMRLDARIQAIQDAAPRLDAAMMVDGAPDRALDQALPLDAMRPAVEVCDGDDEDGDGRIDEGDVCVDYVLEHCRLSLGITNDDTVPQVATDAFGPCVEGIAREGQRRCVHTTPANPIDADPLTALVRWDGVISPPAAVLIRFACDGPSDAMNQWATEACGASMLVLDEARLADGVRPSDTVQATDPNCSDAWARDRDGAIRCVTTGGSHFSPLWLDVEMTSDTMMGIAWQCRSADFPAAAEGLQQHVQVHLTVQTPQQPTLEACGDALDRSPVGQAQCDFLDDWNLRRCARTEATGAFAALNFPPPQACIALGIGLRRRPD